MRIFGYGSLDERIEICTELHLTERPGAGCARHCVDRFSRTWKSQSAEPLQSRGPGSGKPWQENNERKNFADRVSKHAPENQRQARSLLSSEQSLQEGYTLR